jgi:hypothetical protein
MATITVQAQFNVSMSAGGSSKSTFVASLQADYTVGYLNIGYDQRMHLDKQNPAYLGAQIGLNKLIRDELTLMPYIGYWYKMKSNDDKSLNGYVPGGGVKLIYRYFALDLWHGDKTAMITIGFRGTL